MGVLPAIVFLSKNLRLAVGLFVGPQEGIDPGLIAFALGFEPGEDVLVQADGDGHFGLGQLQDSVLEKGLVLFGKIGKVDVLIPQGVNPFPVGGGFLFQRGFAHFLLPF